VTQQKQTILAEADSIVNGQRREDYGGPFESFSDIAKGWSMVLGTTVTPEQVGLCMIQLKVARAKNGGFHRDSFVDIAGYAQCMEFIHDHRASRGEEAPKGDPGLEGQLRFANRYRHGDDGRICEQLARPAGDKDAGQSGWVIVIPGGSTDHRVAGSACHRDHQEDNA